MDSALTRIRHGVVLATLLTLVAPGMAAATPVIDSLGVEDGAVANTERSFVIGASDSQAAVSGAVLSFEGEGAGSSACRTAGPPSTPVGGPFEAASPVVVALPHLFGDPGTGEGAIRVDSGGCAEPTGSLVQPFTATVVAPGQPPRPLVLGAPIPLPRAPIDPPDLPPLVELPLRSPLDDLPLAARSCRRAHAPVGRSRQSRHRLRLAVRCLVNRARRRRGLSPLGGNGRLLRAANAHSRAMVRRGFFSHFGPRPPGHTLVDRLRRARYIPRRRRWTVGENLAWGTRASSPATIFRAWMRSSSHRRNILYPSFRDIGIGIRRGTPISRSRGVTYTTDFGRRH